MEKLEEFNIAAFIESDDPPEGMETVLNDCYTAVLEAQMLPPPVRESLVRDSKVEKKWKTIKAFHSMMENEAMVASSSFSQHDRDILERIRTSRMRPDMGDILHMKSRVSTANKTFMEAWISADGMIILVNAIQNRSKPIPMGELDVALLYEMICTMKIIINTGITMELFLATRGSIRAITSSLSLSGDCKPLSMQVLEVLAVLCDYSSAACADVVCYLREHGRHRKERPFAMLIEGITHHDVEVKAAILQFINSMLGGTYTLEDRMLIRNDLNALDFSKVVSTAVSTLDLELDDILQSKCTTSESSESFNHSVPNSENTSIDPMNGVMHGKMIASKNQGGMLRAIGANKATKRRWFELGAERLSWWHIDDMSGAPAGSIDMKDILEIHAYGHGEDIYKQTPHLLEVVTSTRTHTFGVESEETKQNWLAALNVRMEKNILARSSYNLTTSKINHCEFDNFADFFQKQVKVYEAIAETDYNDAITASGICLSCPVDMVKYLETELASMGLGSYLIHLLQEMIVVPVDSSFVEEYWKILVNICQDIRNFKHSHGGLSEDHKKSLLSVEKCVNLFDQKEKSTGGKAVSELKKLKMQLFTKNDEIERLKNRLEAVEGPGRKDEEYVRVKSSSMDSHIVDSALKANFKINVNAESNVSLKSNQLDGATKFQNLSSKQLPSRKPVDISVKELKETNNTSSPGKLNISSGGAVGALFGAKGGGRGSGGSRQQNQGDDEAVRLQHHSKGKAGGSLENNNKGEGECESTHSKFSEKDHGALGALFGAKGGGGRGPGKLGAKQAGSALGALFGAKGGGGRGNGGIKPRQDTEIRCAVLSSARKVPIPPPLPPGASVVLGIPDTTQTGIHPPLGHTKKNRIYMSKHKAKKKMKGVFWSKVNCNDLAQDNLWKNINLKDLDQLQLNYDNIEESFGQLINEKAKKEVAPRNRTEKKDILLDGKRTQTVLITLGKIRKSSHEIVDMILYLNPVDLTYDMSELLQNIVPTTEEAKLLACYQKDISNLAQAEENLMMLQSIPRLEQRLQCHKIVFTWNAIAERLESEVLLLTNACNQLTSPSSVSKMEKILSVVLAVGNFMNGGSSRVAEAVTIDSIIKFSTIKANDHKKTLLHFVIQELKSSYSESLNFYENWKSIYSQCGEQTAADLSFSSVLSEKNMLVDDIKKIDMELVALEKVCRGDHSTAYNFFVSRVEPFLTASRKRLASLETEVASCEKLLKETLAKYGYRPCSDEDLSKTFFKTLSDIVSLIIAFGKDVDKWVIQEKEKTVEEVDKKSQQNIFGNFRDQQKGSSDDIIQQLKKKMELRKKNEGN